MRTKRLLAFVTAAMLLAAGCSNSSSQNETAASSEGAKVKEGGEIVVGVQQDIDTLDRHKTETAGTREILFNIYEGLVKPNSKGELLPAVAEKYSISDDGKEYTFDLRKGVKFHNGNEVTAEDVKYSLDRAAGLLESDQGNILDSNLKSVEKVTIEDEDTVKVTLKEGDTEFIAYMTTAIMPKDNADPAKDPIGTGPFKFESYTPQDKLVIVKNNDYYGTPAHLDKVTFKIIADADSSVILAMQNGSIDIYPYLTADQASQLKKDFNIEVGSTNLVHALFLNNAEKPFDDVRVRQALCYLVNKKEVIDMVFDGYGQEIGSGVFPSFGLYFDKDLVDTYDPDNTNVEKAKELLKEAGYPDGFTFTITVPSNYQPHIDTAQVIAEQLKKGGITAKIELVEWASWVSDVYLGRKYVSTVIGLDADLAPKALLGRYDSESTKNFVNFKSDDYDKAIRAAIASTSQDEKVKLYKECQEILNKEAASVYIQDPASLVAVNKKLAGYTFYPLYVQDMSLVYFAE